MSDSSSDSEGLPDNFPSVAECQKRVDDFVLVTGTNQALAQSYLQTRAWIVKDSVNDYYAELDRQIDLPATYQLTTEPPSQFKVLSWNIDGLDGSQLRKRTESVIDTVQRASPDIVLLQEVVPETHAMLARDLPEYKMFTSDVTDYYNATLVRVFTMYYDSHIIKPYSRTMMNRKQLITDVHVGNTKMVILNTHLESTGEHASVRVGQLQTCFKTVLDSPENVTVIFGGDLNLRDKEVALAGGIPSGVDDVWESTGQRHEAKYTWDLKINTNHQMPGRFQPRLRFDRFYVKHSVPQKVHPVHFGLVGIDKVPGTQCFPSDHWGIQAVFNVNHG